MADTDEIKSRLDIVEIISERVQLQKAGRNYKANCPFHNEKTPSFIVDPSRQSWRCFGQCSEGGDVFNFLMKVDQIEFGEALGLLAQRAGVDIDSGRDTGNTNLQFEINNIASNFYQEALVSPEGSVARAYLDKRGVSSEIGDKFGLGYSPRGRDSLKTHLSFHGVDLGKAVECGLLTESEDGVTRDFFWGRLMFPIHDRQGRVVGFGARALDDAMPKYINTAATSVFDKRRTLYGFHLSREAIRSSNEGVIVEGYMDVIAAHQFGYKNVVASMGTALTPEQVQQLRNIASSYVLALDQDSAGKEATLRSLETSWKIFEDRARTRNRDMFAYNPIKLKVLSLPEGKDPDEFMRSGEGDWSKVLESALPVMDYLIPVLVEKFDIQSLGGKERVVGALAPLLRTMSPFDRDDYVAVLAKVLDASPETVRIALQKTSFRTPRGHKDSNDSIDSRIEGSLVNTYESEDKSLNDIVESKSIFSKKPLGVDDHLLRLIVSRPDLRTTVSDMNIEADFFDRTEDKELYSLWMSVDLKEKEEFEATLDGILKVRYQQLTKNSLPPMTLAEAQMDLDYRARRVIRNQLKLQAHSIVTARDGVETPPSDKDNETLNSINKQIMETENPLRYSK